MPDGAGERPRRERLRLRISAHALAYLVPALLAAVAAQSWFEPGKVIGSGDLDPPVEQRSHYRSLWNHLWTSEGGPTFSIVRLPYWEGLRLAGALGLGEDVFQRLWLTGLVVGCALGVVYFVSGFSLGPFVSSAAGVFAVFNVFVLLAVPNAIPMAALMLATVLGGLVVRRALRPEAPTRVLSFALASLALCIVVENPPHVALVLAWLAVSVAAVAAVGGRPALARAAGFLARAAPLVVLVNVWWVVPVLLTVGSPTFASQFSAPGVEDWSWTHARASLANVIALDATWAWTHPEYYPYAERLARPPFDALRYFLPVLALLGVILARDRARRLALVLGVAAVGLILVGKGTHAPLSGVNTWLYDTLPGYWLFREPFKALLLLALAFAILGAIALPRLARMRGLPPVVAGTVAVALTAGALAYSHPLYTGEAVPDERPILPPAHIQVPGDWSDATRFLNDQPPEGNVVVLPLPDFYQLPTTWGYHGVPFTRTMLERAVLEPQPGGYFASDRSVDHLIASLQRDLVGERPARVLPKLRALGARYVLLRHDLDREAAFAGLEDPRAIARGLGAVPGLRRRSFGILDVYEVTDGRVAEVFAAHPIPLDAPDPIVPAALELEPDGALVDRADVADGLEPEEATARLIAPARWRVAVASRGSSLVVRFSSADRRGVLRTSHVRLGRPDGPFVLAVRESAFPVERVSSEWQLVGTVLDGGEVTVRAWEPDRAPAGDLRPNGGAPSALPEVTYERVSPSELRIRVEGAREPFLLVATEAFASGWRLTSPPSGEGAAAHVLVNGYANGWVVPWTGSYTVTAVYGPESLARWARWVGALAVLSCLVAWLLTGPLAPRLVRLRRPRPISSREPL